MCVGSTKRYAFQEMPLLALEIALASLSNPETASFVLSAQLCPLSREDAAVGLPAGEERLPEDLRRGLFLCKGEISPSFGAHPTCTPFRFCPFCGM